MPNLLHVYQIGEDFKVTRSDKKTVVYNVVSKKLSTRADFKFLEPNSSVRGYVKGGEILGSQFTILGPNEEKQGSLQLNRISNLESTMQIKFMGIEYKVKDHSKGHSIDIKTLDGNLQFTIDKKILHIRDSYLVHKYGEIGDFLPSSICIILDVIYHP